MSRIAPARLVIEPDGRGSLSFPYDPRIVAAIKGLPHRTRAWDPAQRCWRIEPGWVAEAAEVVKRFVDLDITSSSSSPACTPEPSGSWARQLRNRLPEHLRQPAFKALVRVTHPDVGGDAAITRELLDAFRAEERRAS